MKKKSNLKDLSVDDLKVQLTSEEENLRRLKFGHAISPIENPMKIREARKTVARINTEIRLKQQ